jgi:hypothetical protein
MHCLTLTVAHSRDGVLHNISCCRIPLLQLPMLLLLLQLLQLLLLLWPTHCASLAALHTHAPQSVKENACPDYEQQLLKGSPEHLLQGRAHMAHLDVAAVGVGLLAAALLAAAAPLLLLLSCRRWRRW